MSKFLEGLIRSKKKSCDGKIKFPREESAIRSAQEMTLKKGNGELFEQYLCNFCEGWHIGHKTNFDWIPKSHVGHVLMLNKYQCRVCNEIWITNTVFSNRILQHFPKVTTEDEECVACLSSKCKTDRHQNYVWLGRLMIDLEEIDPEVSVDLGEIWNLYGHIY